MANFTVSVVLKAVDNLSRIVGRMAGNFGTNLSKMADRVDQFSGKMEGMGRAAGVGGVAILAAMKQPITAFAALEDAATRARIAYMTSAGTDGLFGKITAQATELGNKLPGTTADFLGIAASLKELGLSSQTILNGGLKSTAYLSVLLKIPGQEAAEMAATFSQSLGVASKDFVGFVDTIQRAKFTFGLNPQDFAYTLKYIGPIAQQFGIIGAKGGRDMLALSGALNQVGIKGEQLGTSLRGTFLALPGLLNSKGFRDVAPILDKASIHLEFFKNGKFLGMENLVGQLDKLSKLNVQDRFIVLQSLFGTETATALAAIVGKGKKGYQQAIKDMEKQASLQARLSAVLGTLTNLWDAATGTFTNTLAGIGEAMAPDLKNMVESFNSVSEKIGKFIKANPGLTRAFGLSALAAGGFLTILGGVGLVVGTLGGYVAAGLRFIGNFGKAFRVAGLVIRGFGMSSLGLLANPIVLAGVVALAGGALLIYKYWKPLGAFFSGFWEGLVEGLRPLGRFISVTFSPLRPIFQGVGDAVKGAWEWLVKLIQPVENVGSGARDIGRSFGLWIGLAIGMVGKLIVFVNTIPLQFMRAGQNAISQFVDGMKSNMGAAVKAAGDIADRVGRFFIGKSPVPEGPLRNLHRTNLMSELAKAITPGPLLPAISRTTQAMTLAVAPVLGSIPQIKVPVPVVSAVPQVRVPAPVMGNASDSRTNSQGNVYVTYSPNIDIAGGGGDDFKQLLREHSDDLVKILKRAVDRQMRGEY